MRTTLARLLAILLVAGLVPLGEAGLYRWVDEDGNVHYSDNVPAEHVRSERTELSDHGVRIKTVPAAKDLEEIEKEQALERLRKQREELLEEQRSADLVLLRTFRSEDDISMARDGKVAAIDVMIDVTKNNIRLQQEKHARLITEAADLERVKKPVPEHLSDSIAQTERGIRDAYATIVVREEQKRSIRESFDRDLARFRQLKHLPTTDSEITTTKPRPVLHNIVACADARDCRILWARATAYVDKHATTPVQGSSNTFIITAPPAAEQDVSLILVRIDDQEGPGASLFLDLRCHRSIRGQEICKGPEARGIIEGFGPALATGKEQPH